MSRDALDELLARKQYAEALEQIQKDITPDEYGGEWPGRGEACYSVASGLQGNDPAGAAYFYARARDFFAQYASGATSGGEGAARMLDVRRAEEALRDLGRKTRPGPDELGFTAGYCARVPFGEDIVQLLQKQLETFASELRGMPSARQRYRYDWNKWSVAEVVGHINDSERVFAYRALRFGRGDTTPLPGFDQDPWVAASQADRRDWNDLINEWDDVRRASLSLFKSLPHDAWVRRGVASGVEISVRALANALWGHVDHHLAVLRERYLS